MFIIDTVDSSSMAQTCLNCGKPLGSRSTLCYGCASSGVDPEAITDVDDEVLDRLERYFIISATKCAECEELHRTVTVEGDSYTAADFGIDSLDEWKLEMEKEETWIRDNRDQIQPALPQLEDEWPQTVGAVRSRLL